MRARAFKGQKSLMLACLPFLPAAIEALFVLARW